jgi:hypothetical protein
MSAETKFTVTLIAIGAGTIAAKGLGGYGALFETWRVRLASVIHTAIKFILPSCLLSCFIYD